MEFTIVSWNVHMGLHNDGGTNDIAEHCARFCDVYGVDVIALQEAWDFGRKDSTLTRDVAAACNGELHDYTWPGHVDKYPARWTIAIVTRLDATRIDDLTVPTTDGPERAALRIRLDAGPVVTTTHLDGVHAIRRPKAFMSQRQTLGGLAAASDVLVGDFNMWSPIVNRVATPLRPAVGGRTWPAGRPHSQIDHIMVSDRIDVVSSQVLPDTGSDHLPVMARLRIVDPA